METKLSVIICCYNSRHLLEPTLRALALQEKTDHFKWEIILVDNNSNDSTADFALTVWEELKSSFTLTVVHEANPGLIFAREKGISEASGDLLIFCDDDNRLAPHYVATVVEEFEKNDRIAVVAGRGIAAFEIEKPVWFDEFSMNYAIGKQKGAFSKLKNIYGAGIGIRRKYLEMLYKSGFTPLLVGRTKSVLLAGEDTEMIFALQLLPVKIKYNNNLTFEHFLTAKRLTFDYLCSLRKGIGAARPILRLYVLAHKNKHLGPFYYHRQLISCYLRIVRQYLFHFSNSGRKARLAYNLGYLNSLRNYKTDFPNMYDKIELLKRNLSQ